MKRIFLPQILLALILLSTNLFGQACELEIPFDDWIVGTSYAVDPLDSTKFGFYDSYLPFEESYEAIGYFDPRFDSIFISKLPVPGFPHTGIVILPVAGDDNALGIELQSLAPTAGTKLLLPLDPSQSYQVSFDHGYQGGPDLPDTIQFIFSTSMDEFKFNLSIDDRVVPTEPYQFDIPEMDHTPGDSVLLFIYKNKDNGALYGINNMCFQVNIPSSTHDEREERLVKWKKNKNTLRFESEQPFEAYIFDIQGRLLTQEFFSAGQNEWHINETSGSYLLQTISGRFITTDRLIIH